MMAKQIAAKARPGEVNHGCGERPTSWRALFTRPWLYSKNQRKIRPAKTRGSAQGEKEAEADRATSPVKGWLARSARPKPTSTAPGTVTTM
jgi:hypothetical protein